MLDSQQHIAASRAGYKMDSPQLVRPANTLTQEPHFPQLPRVVKDVAGLNGNMQGVEMLRNGTSGVQVARVDTTDGSMVLKWDLRHPERVKRELEGWQRLQGTPLESWLLPITFASLDKSTFGMPHFNGVELRSGIKRGEIDTPMATATLDALLDTKLQSWQDQRSNGLTNNGEIVSMQREEWPDTLARLDAALTLMAGRYNVSKYDLVTRPIIVADRQLPALADVIIQTDRKLRQEPNYTVLSHNDATGGNIIVNPDTGERALLDPAWAGNGDPAEAYFRVGKYISATTASRIDCRDIQVTPTGLYIDLHAEVPPTAIAMQNLAFSRMHEFSSALNDPRFPEKVGDYASGSYLREAALSPQRGLDGGIFALIKAADVSGVQ